MKWKFLTAILLSGVIVFSGCSPSNSISEQKAGEGTASSSSTPVNLTWFSDVSFWDPPSPWNTNPNSVEGQITKKTGLTFTIDIPAQDADTKLSLLLASMKPLPDVMTIINNDLAKKLIDSGKVWRLDELLKKYDPNSHLLKDFPNDVKQGLIARDGGWYSYPSHINSNDERKKYPPSSEFYSENLKYRDNNGIMVNKKLMQQAGISLDNLKTEDGLLAAYKKIKEIKLTANGAPVIPLQVDAKGYQDTTLLTLEMMFGAMPVDKNGKYRDIILAPESKHALDFMYKAAQAGYFNPNQMTVDTSGMKAAVLSGSVFSYIGSIANSGFEQMDVWVSPGPILSNQGTKPVLGHSLRAGTGWMQTYISKSTKEPERLAKWLSFMSSNEGLTLHVYGIEGNDYLKDSKGLVVQTQQGIKDKKNQSKTGVFAFWSFHNISWLNHVTFAPTKDPGSGVWDSYEVLTAFGKAKETVIYDNSALSMPPNFFTAGSKIADRKAQIIAYKQAQISKIILAKDANTRDQLYKEMISQLKKLGLDDLDDKINEQFQKQSPKYNITLKGVNS
ncbi:hypothetical protein V7157_02690 [Neobacillus drentensis]|uniref:hypothetical protein n=1 Tax=Neobacillus drentensis TaxID=220684 RepID=UPI002FFD925E